MSDKPREFWIDPVGDTVDGEFDAIVFDKEPPHIAIHVIEYAAFEKVKAELSRIRCGMGDDFGDDPVKVIQTLKAENERLKAELSIADLKTHKEKTLRILALLNECDTLKAKLAEVEAELEKLRSRHLWNSTYADTEEGLKNLDCSPEVLNSIKTRRQLERELTREREAARVMREALNEISNESGAFDEFAERALAKADEIRGGGVSWKKTEHFKNTEFGPMSDGYTIETTACENCDRLEAMCEKIGSAAVKLGIVKDLLNPDYIPSVHDLIDAECEFRKILEEYRAYQKEKK